MKQNNQPDFDWQAVDALIAEMIIQQQQKVFACGQRIIPNITSDDLLQPNDFKELENHPIFRYEEGVLEGLYSVQMALWAMKKDRE